MRRLTMLLSLPCLTAALVAPASVLEYDIAASGDPEYGKPISVELVAMADCGEFPNVDVSKSVAPASPVFGSLATYTLNTGTPLTPNLAPGRMLGDGAVINGSADITVASPDYSGFPSGGTSSVPPTIGFAEATSDLYYQGGYLATLKIPNIDIDVKVYEETRSAVLRKGAGHFEDISVWTGNVCSAAHNRDVNAHFGEIHTLDVGDKITLAIKLGKRTYAVTSVNKISELDNSLLSSTAENCTTLFTCVRNQSVYRWAVRTMEAS